MHNLVSISLFCLSLSLSFLFSLDVSILSRCLWFPHFLAPLFSRIEVTVKSPSSVASICLYHYPVSYYPVSPPLSCISIILLYLYYSTVSLSSPRLSILHPLSTPLDLLSSAIHTFTPIKIKRMSAIARRASSHYSFPAGQIMREWYKDIM